MCQSFVFHHPLNSFYVQKSLIFIFCLTHHLSAVFLKLFCLLYYLALSAKPRRIVQTFSPTVRVGPLDLSGPVQVRAKARVFFGKWKSGLGVVFYTLMLASCSSLNRWAQESRKGEQTSSFFFLFFRTWPLFEAWNISPAGIHTTPWKVQVFGLGTNRWCIWIFFYLFIYLLSCIQRLLLLRIWSISQSFFYHLGVVRRPVNTLPKR